AQVISVGDDDVFVPVGLADRRRDFSGRRGHAGDIDLRFSVAGGDAHLLSRHGDDTAAFFLVEHADVFPFAVHITLVSADDPVVSIDHFAAILDAGVGEVLVVVWNEAELGAQLEIFHIAALPDEKRVLFGRAFGGGLTGDRSIDNRPERRITFPPGEIAAVEKTAEIFLRRLGRQRT